MDHRWNWVAITGIALCSSLNNVNAGEAFTREFDGWTVKITPKSAPPVANHLRANVSKDASTKTEQPKANSRKILIRPISFEPQVELNDQPVPQQAAAPAPEAVETTSAIAEPVAAAAQPTEIAPINVVTPAVETSVAPTLSPVSEALPPAPTPNSKYESYDLPIITPKRRDHDELPPKVVPQTANYSDIYYSIPFIRAEYDANRSYRHDATMEFMFNQMRPTVIQRGTTNVHNFGGGGYGYGGGYDGYGMGWDPPYYPFSYGLRLHRSR